MHPLGAELKPVLPAEVKVTADAGASMTIRLDAGAARV
jgi:hypothetical protein